MMCVWIRGREGGESVCNRCVDVLMYNYAESERNIRVIISVTPSPIRLHNFLKRSELLGISV